VAFPPFSITAVGVPMIIIPCCMGLFSIDREWKSHKGSMSDNSIMLTSKMRLKWKNDSFLSISIYGIYIMLRNIADFIA
jgi:hypothetical protein